MSAKAEQEQALRQRTPEGRILSLDALRGVAAFVVIWHHLRLCFYTGEPRWYLRPIFAGHASVVLFFVLSGYVLAIPSWRGRQPKYPRYIVRRFCRIYLPFVGGALFAYLVGRHLTFSHTGLSEWFGHTWQVPMTPLFLLRQLYEVPGDAQLNTAFWSLHFEFEVSLIFPFLCVLLGRIPTWVSFVVSLVVWKLALVGLNHTEAMAAHEVLQTARYGVCFVLGAVLSQERARIGVWYREMPRWLRALAACAVVVGVYASHDTVLPLAVCGVLIFAEYGPLRNWLSTAIPEYLGRISYSMYLVHGTVLWALMILLRPHVSLSALVLAYAVTTLVVSHLFCVAVEEPTMRLGKRLTATSKPKELGSARIAEVV